MANRAALQVLKEYLRYQRPFYLFHSASVYRRKRLPLPQKKMVISEKYSAIAILLAPLIAYCTKPDYNPFEVVHISNIAYRVRCCNESSWNMKVPIAIPCALWNVHSICLTQ